MFEEEVIKCWKKKCGTSQCLLHRERHCLCVLHVCVPGVWFCCLFFSCYVLMHLLQCLHREVLRRCCRMCLSRTLPLFFDMCSQSTSCNNQNWEHTGSKMEFLEDLLTCGSFLRCSSCRVQQLVADPPSVFSPGVVQESC
ncbi:uncharacterized protein LOC119304099 isoform X1 [Triticum dicoccoides]|uniref:uncharacterized protein LOC119304099 isoform X1 n=1 Tax=Triticum dicoccoides TaxID=85692 RepID=UPI00188DE8FA|nr:uncharacterized protein LOC119304099 isoform X1 [Triticum dicoccoides]